MPFVVVYDACVLHPGAMCNLLMRLAEAGIVHARVPERIVDECIDSIARERPELPSEALAHRRKQMLTGVRAPRGAQ